MNARDILELRARLRRDLRGLFDGLGFLEVDTPVLAADILPEAHIDPLVVPGGKAGPCRYLQASPELFMKRLLAAGAGPIYQFARCFRAGETGRQHDEEFVLLEWYAPGTTLDDTALLLERLCADTLGTRGIDRTTCAEAFLAHAGVDPLTASLGDLEAAVARHVPAPPTFAEASPADRRDRAFELLLAEVVQPRLGHDRPVMLERWPAAQAAFARVDPQDPRAALRFELFVAGVELANGWEEETSREVLAERIAAANRVREAAGRGALPVPEALVAAHGPGMPAGVGVALGFDRLAMLAANADTLAAIRCFGSGTESS
jgi:lysyl-tRNA synthetase class 2